nr:uncharacterized protein LOC111999292 [Quercus suber]
MTSKVPAHQKSAFSVGKWSPKPHSMFPPAWDPKAIIAEHLDLVPQEVAQPNITKKPPTTSMEFLGMTILDGKYTLQPHIATSLKEFPDKFSIAKQIQQFLRIVNYMSDFIPNISKYRNCLAQLLKKNPPEWDLIHMEAVQQLKKLAERLPLFQIPGPSKLVLQIDASDE